MKSHTLRTTNDALARAIFDSRQTKRTIAALAGVEYTRFSKILHGRGWATKDEKRKIAKTLGKRIRDLFPVVAETRAA